MTASQNIASVPLTYTIADYETESKGQNIFFNKMISIIFTYTVPNFKMFTRNTDFGVYI